ncbi:MAG: BatA and WFA domain-containing protein [Elusimicrobiota bacterium]
MNFSFLNPFFLWGLALASLPILIHLLTRKKFRPLLFSTIIFLKKASQKILPRYRLRQWLLLAVRTLLLILLTLFFARPIIHFYSSQDKTSNLASVILLDTSYSMSATVNNQTKFEQAREVALETIAGFQPQDRLALITFSNRIENKTPFSSPHSEDLIKTVTESAITCRPTTVIYALEEAYQLLTNCPGSKKQIIIVSDLAQHGWKKIIKGQIQGFDPKVMVCFLKLGDNESNLACQNISLLSMVEKRKQILPVEIKNFSAEDKKNAGITLWLEGKQADSGFLNIAPQQKAVKELSYTFHKKGSFPCWVELEPDILELDNRMFFIQKVLARIPVLCVDGDPQFVPVRQETFYLKFALAPDKTAPLDVKVVNLSELEKINWPAYPVIFLANCNLDEKQSELIKNYWRKGGKIIIFCGDKINPAAYNRFLEELLPAELVSVVSQKQTVSLADQQHPALQIFADPAQIDLKSALVEKFVSVKAGEGSQALFNYANGQPAVLEKEGVILFTTTADRDWSNLAVKPIYVSLLQNLVNYLSVSKDEEANNFLIGEEFRFVFSRERTAYSLIYPDGKKEERKSKQLRLTWEKPGLYQLFFSQGGKEEIHHYAVNPDYRQEESDLRSLPLSEINELFPVNILIEVKEGWKKKFMENLRGKEINRQLLALIILLLVIEVFLANPWKRKK